MIERKSPTALWLWLALAGLAALPFVELAAFFWVAGRIGLFPALLLAVATSFAGVFALRHEGARAFSRLVSTMRSGAPPEGAARDGFRVALGSVLLILPGFVTDVIGAALLLPAILRRLGDRSPATVSARRRPADRSGKVIDLDEGEWRNVDDGRRRIDEPGERP